MHVIVFQFLNLHCSTLGQLSISVESAFKKETITVVASFMRLLFKALIEEVKEKLKKRFVHVRG